MKTQYKHLLQRTYLVLVFGFMYLPIAVSSSPTALTKIRAVRYLPVFP